MNPAQVVFAANALVPLTEVLDTLLVEYRGVPSQIRCPVHKFGTEEKPSAHIYEDNSIYCFTCSKQYGPVDVWSALRGIDSLGAAQALLEKWDIPEDKAREVSRGITLPKHKTIPEGLLDHLEQTLLEYRGSSDLGTYREWCRRIQDLSTVISEIPLVEQQRRLEFIRFQMRQELSSGG